MTRIHLHYVVVLYRLLYDVVHEFCIFIADQYMIKEYEGMYDKRVYKLIVL